jgi:hypothetical protein
MKLVGAGLLLMVVCVLGGCATYWYQEGKTFDETRYDLAACQAEAMRYSDVGRTQGLGSFEQKFVRGCMEQKGYRLVKEQELSIRVKRESSPVFGIPGVAGSID